LSKTKKASESFVLNLFSAKEAKQHFELPKRDYSEDRKGEAEETRCAHVSGKWKRKKESKKPLTAANTETIQKNSKMP